MFLGTVGLTQNAGYQSLSNLKAPSGNLILDVSTSNATRFKSVSHAMRLSNPNSPCGSSNEIVTPQNCSVKQGVIDLSTRPNYVAAITTQQ